MLSSLPWHNIIASISDHLLSVFPHLDLHGAWGKGCDFLLHAVSNTRVHGGTTRQDIIGVQVLPDVNVTLHDAVVSSLMNTSRLHTCQANIQVTI